VTANVAGIALLAVLGGCCSHWVDIETFRQSPLAQQIPEYERGFREGCIPREGGQAALLTAMSTHGLDSADVMTNLLKHPSPDFPLEDAMDVLVNIHYLSADLREHESMRVLASLAATAPNPAIRARAQETLEKIKNYHPGRARRQPG
jgi:hypothetical protein